MNKILGFKDDYRFLSNFHIQELKDENGVLWPTSEHWYQAEKFVESELREKIRLCATPKESRYLGRRFTMRPDFDDIKLEVMRKILKVKFANGTELANKLIATGEAYLEETNWWKDSFWGVCKGVGQNNLGKLLMERRKELLDETLGC